MISSSVVWARKRGVGRGLGVGEGGWEGEGVVGRVRVVGE